MPPKKDEPITPELCDRTAEALRRLDVAAEDVGLVMDAAKLLSRAGVELERVLKNRDRLMRNRNNKQQEIRELRARVAELEGQA